MLQNPGDVCEHTDWRWEGVRFGIYFEDRATRLAVRLDMGHEKKRHKRWSKDGEDCARSRHGLMKGSGIIGDIYV